MGECRHVTVVLTGLPRLTGCRFSCPRAEGGFTMSDDGTALPVCDLY